MADDSIQLLLDGMLGRLARWLRLLGYDAAYENDADDLHLARRARAEGRVLLTRDRELAARKGLRTVLIASEDLEDQIEQVRQALGPPPDPALSRCTLCNIPLQEASRDQVAGRVPPYVLRTQEAFRVCPRCRRVYWAGTHLDHMREQVEAAAEMGLGSEPESLEETEGTE
jgi:uncharacterized protein with PIN domain